MPGQLFTFIATASTLLFWLGFSSGNVKLAVVCAAVGILGPARTLGATTSMTTEGARLGIPQGQLSGDRANMVAWLKARAAPRAPPRARRPSRRPARAPPTTTSYTPAPRPPASAHEPSPTAPPPADSRGSQVLRPLVYGKLYLSGLQAGVPTAPFFFNVALTLAALLLGPAALSAGAAAGEAKK